MENGACQCVRTLLRAGVDTMFANPGTTEMLIVEALDRVVAEEESVRMRGVLCLHETVCSGAADGYARMTGRPACTLLHLGVGLANATANLHNAKRAGTPVINIVGDMATWHVGSDPLLASDLRSLAEFSSCAVVRPTSASAVAEATAEAALSVRDYHRGASRVATICLPHDAQREGAQVDAAAAGRLRSLVEAAKRPRRGPGEPSLFVQSIKIHNTEFGGKDAIPKHVAQCAAALRSARKGALLVGGAGSYDDDALDALEAISRTTGCALVVENAFSRVDRGAGRPDWVRAPYFPNDAKNFFHKFDAIVLCGARRPVAMFGYSDNVSALLPDQGVHEIDAMDVPGALRYLRDILCDQVDTPKSTPEPPRRPPDCSGRLTAAKLCQVVAAVQPPNCVVVDESLTSGTAYWDLSKRCPPFAHLTLTGGSIGIGLPLAVGCAVACPERRVVVLQADGSGLYSTPALWTMARERLDITVVVCANHTYQILKVEQQKQRLSTNLPYAKQLTTLNDPPVDWVHIATGYGIRAAAVTTADDLKAKLLASFDAKGPFLVEAKL